MKIHSFSRLASYKLIEVLYSLFNILLYFGLRKIYWRYHRVLWRANINSFTDPCYFERNGLYIGQGITMLSRAGMFRVPVGVAVDMNCRVFDLPSFHGMNIHFWLKRNCGIKSTLSLQPWFPVIVVLIKWFLSFS